MNQRFTYSIPTHALSFPATASHICVSEPRPTSLNHPVQPLKGLRNPRAASVSYWALAPNGANMPFRIPATHSALLSIVHCSLYIVHWSYTFSAKERDSETGLSYFGSRYYSSDLSIWLSVDPMSDKYAYQSGYVYCGNNPIKVIDPNGEDEWEVNEAGYIRCIHNDKPDRLYAVYGSGEEDWGERRLDVKPLDVDESIMKTMGNPGKSTTFSAQNKREKMNELFNFFADNTDVEWTQLCTHDNYGNEYDFIVTSHDNVGTELPSIYTVVIFNNAQDGLFDIFKHSHPKHYTGDNYYHKSIYPYTSHIASGGDMKTKAKIEQANGFVRRQPMFILRNGGLNYEY